MSHPRTRMTLEPLEPRDVPSSVTQTFDTAPALPGGWTQWSSDGSTAFATAAGQGTGGTGGVVTSGGSRTAALAWQSQTEPGDATVSADVYLSSLVPTFVFARGSNLGTATPSYLAAVVTRGATVSVVQVTNGVATVLGTVASPSAVYFSRDWVHVSLVPSGSSVAVQVQRADTNQYLSAAGTWQSAATNAVSVTTSLADTDGEVGIGRVAEYAGPVRLDNFTVTSPTSPPPAPPPPPPPASGGVQSFDTTGAGALPAGWQSWVSNPAGAAGVSASAALSPNNSFALSGASNTAARAWSATVQPAAVTASVAVDLNSLIPAQLFVNGANLNTATPTYDAVVITRGLQASLVQVINGQATTLATVQSSDYVSGKWVDVELTAQGSSLAASIYRTDTKQWLTATGNWSATPTFAFTVSNATSLAAGAAGIGRAASYYGTINFDNFTAGAAGTVGPAVTVTSNASAGAVSGAVTFQAAVPGATGPVSFLLNGQVAATSTAPSASWTLDSTRLANGTYTLTVLAGGADGTVGTGTYTFTVSNASPPPPTAPQQTISANPISAVGYALPPATDTLFGPNGPSYLDVHQGQSGDCWLIAALAEVAAQDPQAIRDMFTYDGTTTENGTVVGVYTVRFFDSNNVAEYVTIDTLLPAGGGYYDQPVNGVLWVALAEKAYAVANGLGYVTSGVTNTNSYDALYSGTASWAIQAVTGKPAGNNFTDPAQVAAAVQAGGFVVLATDSPPDSHILSNHAYAVVGYDASTGLFKLMNPWGGTTSSNLSPENSQIYGLFTATASFVAANCPVQSVGTR